MAAYNGSATFNISRPLSFRDGVNSEAITGAGLTLVASSATLQIISNATGGTQDLTLPAALAGLTFWIKNDPASTGNVAVKIASGTTIGNMAAGTVIFVASDGTNWY